MLTDMTWLVSAEHCSRMALTGSRRTRRSVRHGFEFDWLS